MLDEKELLNIYDLVSVTMNDMFFVTKDRRAETINIYCDFLKEPKEIILPIAEIVKFKKSAKDFINYLKEKMTEGLKASI